MEEIKKLMDPNGTIEFNRLNINLSQLRRNYQAITALIKPGIRFMAVVKGNAYGHGLAPVGKALELFGCEYLGVVRVSEAILLREAEIKTSIMILSPVLPYQIESALQYNLTLMVDNKQIAYKINEEAVRQNKSVKIHVKLNTGLNRFGVEADEAIDFVRDLKQGCGNLELEGIYTHFRDPEFNKEFTDSQIQIFNRVLSQLEELGMRPPIAHAAATGGILLYPDAQYDMVRCGILLYGEEYLKGRKIMPYGVQPITSLVSRITKIIEVKAGSPVGYGDRCITERDSRIAVIGIGYADGVSRGWKQVLVNGQKVNLINYSMDCIEADITDVQGSVREYDEVVLIGQQGSEKITWEDACNGMNSEVDEQLQRLTNRVPKHYLFEE